MNIFSSTKKNIIMWSAFIFGLIAAIISIYNFISLTSEKEIETTKEINKIINESFDLLGMKPQGSGVLSWKHQRGHPVSTPEKRKNLEKVRRNIETLQLIDPDNEVIKFFNISYLLQYGDFKGLKRFLKKEEVGIPEYQVYSIIGNMIANYSGSIELASKYLEKSIKLNPKDANTRASFGLLLHSFNLNTKSITHLKEAIRLNPSNVTYRNKFAHVLAESGKMEEAEKILKDLVGKESANSETYNSLGVLYSTKEKYNEAISMYKKAIELYPSYSVYYFNMSLSYNKLGENENAIKYRKIAEEIGDLPNEIFSKKNELF